ncbi:MAG: Ig domain-containing protein [Lachnospiraceae bacterium]|nr:Ig domain-containing protein [Lachnospiraceae bacterium]
MKDIVRQIKRHWKVLTALCVAATVTVIGMVMLFASEIVVTVTASEEKTEWLKTDAAPVLTAAVTSLPDGVTVSSETITWSSSNSDAVSVSPVNGNSKQGQLVFIGAGYATISCTYDMVLSTGETAQRVISRNYLVKLETTSNSFNVMQVGTGGNSQITLKTNYSSAVSDDSKLKWSSSNEDIVRVESAAGSDASIKAIGAGVATITATIADETAPQSVSFTVLVKASFNDTASVEVKPGEYTSIYEAAEANAPNPTHLVWYTPDDGTHITMDVMGRAEGNMAGTATVYMYTSYDYSKLSATDWASIGVSEDKIASIINDPVKLSGYFGAQVDVKVLFGINGGDKVVSVGDIVPLTSNIDNTLIDSVQWSSSNNNVVEVNSKGEITAVRAGTATITALIKGNKLYPTDTEVIHTADITVHVVDNFMVNKTDYTLNKGESFELKAIPTDTSETTTISWSSSDDSIAKAEYDPNDPYGAIIHTGEKTGIAIITATQTSADGVRKTATCTVTVTEPVLDVIMSPKEAEITVGGSYQLQLIFNSGTDTDIPDNYNVKWVSSDEEIATVTKSGPFNGLVSAHKGGDVVISAVTVDNILVASCKVHVRVPVTAIQLTNNEVTCTMALGTYQLSYEILPEGDGVNREVTWESSNTAIATVDQKGLVTFVSPGKVTIICKTVDTGVEGKDQLIDTCEFTIERPVEEVRLDYNEVTLKIDETFRLTALVLPEDATNKELIWKSSDESVAKVDETGNITAVGAGSATIMCQSADSGVFDYCNVSVYQPVTGVKLNNHEMSVRKGTVFWLYATVEPEDAWNKTIVWSTSDKEVATVDQTGMVTAVNPGECTIIATSADSGVVDRCTVIVTEPVSGISLNFEEATVYTNEKVVIIPTVTPIDADNKAVTYMSSDPEVATVNEYGVVTGISGGSAIILVTTVERGLVASCKITVYEFVTSVQILDKQPYINKGVTKRLKAEVKPDTATNTGVIWESSNPNIVSVDGKGNITAVNYGTAVITATAADGSGVYDTYTLTVVKPVEKITVEPSSVTILEGQEINIKATVTPSDATFTEVDWTSSNDEIAKVDFNGTITGVKTGICYVYATSTDGNNIQGKVKVTVKPAVPATAVVINTDQMVLLPGQTQAAQARLKPTKSTDGIEWITGDPTVATVDKNGIVTAKGQGETEIYCVADSGVESSFKVIVLALNSTNITVEQYDSYILDVFGATEDIKWYTNNIRIATVDSNGKVIGRSVGKTTITAKVNGKILRCTVTVTKIKK